MKIYLYILLALFLFSCKVKEKEDPNVFYTCSMDPQVMEKRPGLCPICKMELTKTEISNDKDQGIKLSDQQIELANIKTEEVHPFSISDQIAFRGSLVSDENKVSEISSRVNGRIDRLYFKTVGDKIKPGDHIYDLYSEELQSAIREYVVAKEKSKSINNTDINFNELVESAKEKLLLLDLSERQIEDFGKNTKSYLVPYYSKVSGTISEILINEGDYVNEGSRVFKVVDYSTLWVEAEIYPGQEEFIEEGKEVKVRVTGFPNEMIKGKVEFINPQLEEKSKITLVRIVIKNPDLRFKTGMQAVVGVSNNPKQAIAIPSDAVLHESRGNMVWVKNERGSFIRKMVILGIQSGNLVEITSGLNEGENVVISGSYLLNSEYINRRGTNSMENMPGMKEEMKHINHNKM